MDNSRENYNDIYGVKFVMVYNNGHLNNAKEISEVPNDVTGNDDSMYIFCKKCNHYMNYEKPKSVIMSGYWICPICNKRVREETAYNKINQQNNSWLKDNDFDTEDYDELY